MASLVQSLMEQLESRGAADQIAGRLGVPPEQASSAVSAAVPAMLAALARNSQQPDGAAALSGALERDHDGSVLEDDSYFDSYQERQGDKIVGHVFGGQAPAVESQVSALAGLNGGQAADVMKMLAPLVMGFLGKQQSSGALDTSSLSQLLGGGLNLPGGLGELLGGLTGGGSAASSGGAQAKSPGLGGILGKMFGRR